MKQKPTFKSILLVASFFSLLAFAFVNWHSGISVAAPFLNTNMVEAQMQEDKEEKQELAAPDVAILARVWEIAQRFLDKKN